MPSGVYFRTKENRRNISLSHTGFKQSEESKKKTSDALKGNKNGLGYKFTPEQKKQTTERRKKEYRTGRRVAFWENKKMSKEHKEKIRLSSIGKNLGKKRTKEQKRRMSLSKIGCHHTEETKNKIRNNAKNNPQFGMKNKKHSIITKQKQSKIRLDKINKYGFLVSDETREKISQANKGKKKNKIWMKKFLERRKTMIIPKKDTSIEIKVQDFLNKLNVKFITHLYIKEIKHSYQCDVFIPSRKLIIECDGDYWHSFKKQKIKDKIRTKELQNVGFEVIRLWEHEINDISLEEFKIILDFGDNIMDEL